jgi:hypothetical protein
MQLVAAGGSIGGPITIAPGGVDTATFTVIRFRQISTMDLSAMAALASGEATGGDDPTDPTDDATDTSDDSNLEYDPTA